MSIQNNTNNPIMGYAPDERPAWSPEAHPSSSTSSKPISVNGNTVNLPNDGWYEIQNSTTHQTIHEGVQSATVKPGVYTVINHHTGERHEGIQVGGGKNTPAWESLASSFTSTDLLMQASTAVENIQKPVSWPNTDGTQPAKPQTQEQSQTSSQQDEIEENSFFDNTNLGSIAIPLPGPIALPPGAPMTGVQIDVSAPDGIDSMLGDAIVNGGIGAGAGFANGGGPAGAIPWGLAGIASGVYGNLEVDAQIVSSGGGLPPGPSSTHVGNLLGTNNPEVTVNDGSATFTNPETGASVTYGTNADGVPTQVLTNPGVAGGAPFAIVTTPTANGGVQGQIINDVTLNDEDGDGVTDSFTSSQPDTSAASTPVTNTTVDVGTGAESVTVTTPTGMTIGPAGTNGVSTSSSNSSSSSNTSGADEAESNNNSSNNSSSSSNSNNTTDDYDDYADDYDDVDDYSFG